MTDTPRFEQPLSLAQTEYAKCKKVFDGSSYVNSFLLQPVSESNKEYEVRASISSIGSSYRKGITNIRDIIFRKDLEYSEDMPESIAEDYTTVWGGNDLNDLSKNTLKDALLGNGCYWLIWTPTEQAANAKEEEQLGIRPYIEKITMDRIVEQLTYQDALGNLTMVTVKGSYVYKETKYEKEYKAEYRVYFDTGIVEIWRDTGGMIVQVEEVILGVPEMPIVYFVIDQDQDIPPFINEANLQLQQYNIDSAKFSYNLKLAFPLVTTWGMLMNSQNIAEDGFDNDGNSVKLVEFQASKGIDFPVNPETGAKLGDLEFKEVSGTSDKVLKSTSDDLTKAILEGFVTMTTDTTGNKTTTQSESERVAGESTLASTASKLEAFINRAHDLFCKYAGVPTQGEIIVNDEFVGDELDDLEYKLLFDLLGEEILDKEEFVRELQGYGKLKGVDVDKLIARLTAVGKQI